MTEPSQYFKGRTVQEQMNEVIGYVDVRSAEVATEAIAADVAQVHSDAADAHADALAAAASAAAAAGTLANAVKKTGEASQSIAGDIAVSGDLTGGTVTVPAPVNNTDAANKKYVDDADALKLNIADINTVAVGLTGNQGPIAGTKEFTKIVTLNFTGKSQRIYFGATIPDNWVEIARIKAGNTDRYLFEVTGAVNGTTSVCYGLGMILGSTSDFWCDWMVFKEHLANNSMIGPNKFAVVDNGDSTWSIYWKANVYNGIDFSIRTAFEQSTTISTSNVLIRGEIATPNDVSDVTTLNYKYVAVI